MLKLEKIEKEAVEIYGQKFEINKPTVKQLAKFYSKSKVDGFDEFSESLIFLEEIGFPKEILEQLTSDHYKQIMEFVFSDKKK